ncbi:hypothetical protein GCM10022251_74590 [Phytohabitans flavus]
MGRYGYLHLPLRSYHDQAARLTHGSSCGHAPSNEPREVWFNAMDFFAGG